MALVIPSVAVMRIGILLALSNYGTACCGIPYEVWRKHAKGLEIQLVILGT
jgi:hypothetical protein